jgi:hypothetical protein
MAFDVDVTALEERNQVRSRDPNLFYDPVNGYSKDPTTAGRPNPAWGQIQWINSTGKTESILLATSFTRRFSHHFQAGVTYTRTLARNDNTTGFGYLADNQFNPDADWERSNGFQADTLRGNWIVQLPMQFTFAGSYFYGSGAYYNATSNLKPFSKPGTNRLNTGAPIAIPAAVLDRWDGPAVIATGTVWPRNALKGLPLNKVDMRLTKRIKISGDTSVEVLAEVFNVFNTDNYGGYNTTLTSAAFGQPVASSGNAYVPRSGQLGVRVQF